LRLREVAVREAQNEARFQQGGCPENTISEQRFRQAPRSLSVAPPKCGINL
jgi:hypothetical protein